ncbi:uncharacterized protein N7479_002863 [Penicillium vulpinum]|uniref:uncharacterized protein n=1 Tax=Penicillium vulpinum TaxID=29845 RepID=UPI002546DC45|nr:uncharacterized protein N7479_002863 [Penicillium vulpinum]KAJ5972945.1 hypothetical protein N7479_002863 [Penicillium vulpinum]
MAVDSGPKSFRDIVRNNNRFLVDPLQWTSRHLDLVGCRFEDIATTPVYTKSTQNERSNDGQNPTLASTYLTENERNKKDQETYPKPLQSNDAEALATGLFPETKRDCLIKILVVNIAHLHIQGKLQPGSMADIFIGVTDNSME